MNGVDLLKEFIDKAVRNYKYSADTGKRLKRAVELFEDIAHDDEKQSLQMFKDRIDGMPDRVDIKYPNKFTTSSLMVYKSQVLRALGDFAKYGSSASSMAAWSPKVSKRVGGTSKKQNANNADDSYATTTSATQAEPIVEDVSLDLNATPSDRVVKVLDLPLRGERNTTVRYPIDLTVTEAEKIGAVLKSIALLNED